MFSLKNKASFTAQPFIMKKHILSTVVLLLSTSFGVLAETEANADFMYSSGKIYVVVAVLVSMFLGIVAYMVHLDRKLTKLENQINSSNE